MEIWEHEVSEQDITIAKVVLAGWRIERFYVGGIETPDDQPYYRAIAPCGGVARHVAGGSRLFKTRYTAALAAEARMIEDGIL